MKHLFGIEKAAKADEEMTVVGGYIPQPLAETLALLAVFQGKARSVIIGQAIEVYLSMHDVDKNKLIDLLAKIVAAQWNVYCIGKQTISDWDEEKQKKSFVEECRVILLKRGLTETLITKILKKAKVL